MAALVDTNILVYRFDIRFPAKQKIARDILREGVRQGSLFVPHQAIVEFVAAVTRPIGAHSILDRTHAFLEAERLMDEFPILYPNESIVRNALRGCAAYQMSWFDAHLWAYADYNGLDQILTEDLGHGRRYGGVRVMNPFVAIDPN